MFVPPTCGDIFVATVDSDATATQLQLVSDGGGNAAQPEAADIAADAIIIAIRMNQPSYRSSSSASAPLLNTPACDCLSRFCAAFFC